MAISDRELSAIQADISRTYGSEILTLNEADQTFIFNNGYVTGSDVLNTDVWREYRINNEIADGFEWRPLEYLDVVTKLGIIGGREITKEIADRPARQLKESSNPLKVDQYKELIKGVGLFTAAGDLREASSISGSTVHVAYADIPTLVKNEFDSKMIEQDFIFEIKKKVGATDGELSYVRLKEGREVGVRSMKAQGLAIRRKNLRNIQGTPGQRTRFNSFNNNQEAHYASGSFRSGSSLSRGLSGPRIQGPSGGVGSCKFVIIHRSGSLS